MCCRDRLVSGGVVPGRDADCNVQFIRMLQGYARNQTERVALI